MRASSGSLKSSAALKAGKNFASSVTGHSVSGGSFLCRLAKRLQSVHRQGHLNSQAIKASEGPAESPAMLHSVLVCSLLNPLRMLVCGL